MDTKSKEWHSGYTTAMVYLSDIFESRANALFKRGLRRKDIRMIVAICDAAFKARNRLAEVGPRGMDLVLHKNGTAEFVEKVSAG